MEVEEEKCEVGEKERKERKEERLNRKLKGSVPYRVACNTGRFSILVEGGNIFLGIGRPSINVV